jgi:hypothetical protein
VLPVLNHHQENRVSMIQKRKKIRKRLQHKQKKLQIKRNLVKKPQAQVPIQMNPIVTQIALLMLSHN